MQATNHDNEGVHIGFESQTHHQNIKTATPVTPCKRLVEKLTVAVSVVAGRRRQEHDGRQTGE